MIADDWAFCPISGLPALFSRYLQFIQSEAITSKDDAFKPDVHALDPVCGQHVYLSQVTKVRKSAVSKCVTHYYYSFFM